MTSKQMYTSHPRKAFEMASAASPSVGRSSNRGSFLRPRRFVGWVILSLLPVCLMPDANTAVAQPLTDLVVYLEQRFGLSEPQVRGALGALLVYAQQRLQKSDFDALAVNVPNAERIMQDVKLQGIVTGPLDDIDHYERALASLGIGQPMASQIAPAVLEFLGATGHSFERDVLAEIMK